MKLEEWRDSYANESKRTRVLASVHCEKPEECGVDSQPPVLGCGVAAGTTGGEMAFRTK